MNKVIIPWERYALIAEIAYRFKNMSRTLGKTALQKIVFLLQSLFDINMKYDFSIYIYGPFCSDLFRDLDYVEALEGVNVIFNPTFSGYEIIPGSKNESIREKGRNFLDIITDKLEECLHDFGEFQAKELELISTIIYCAQEGRKEKRTQKDIASLVHEIKPHFTYEVIARTIDWLEKKGYLSVP